MRIYLVTAFCFLAASAAARPDWLSMSSGLRLGFGPEQAGGSSTNRSIAIDANDMPYSFLSATVQHDTTLSGAIGAWFAAGWQRKVELQAEFNYGSDEFKSQEDYGSGLTRSIAYERTFYEMPLLLKLGWPIALKKGALRPFIDGGIATNQTVGSPKRGITYANGVSKTKDWLTPSTDNGYLYGMGLDYSYGRMIFGAEARYREGLNDLDPSGRLEQKARSITFNLSLGWVL